jgi:hypothetical protein
VPNDRVVLDNTGGGTDTASFRPHHDGRCVLGTGNVRWNTIYSVTSTIATSDIREKNNITSLADYPALLSEGNAFEILFSKLKPQTYYLNLESNNPQLHIGFIAQDIVAILEEMGLNESEVGFLHHHFWTDRETGEKKDIYGLRYEEFIALNAHMIQKLMNENNSIKERLNQIEAMLNIN